MERPSWFKRALEFDYSDRYVDCDGAKIHYLLWNDPNGKVDADRPGLVFIHGSGAHAHWWTFIAPFFLTHYRVMAIDLAGAGDSEHLSDYSLESFGAQVMSAVKDAGFDQNTILVGHSFGGFIAIKTALIYGDSLAGIVLADSAVRPPDFEWERDPRRSPIRPRRVYETFEAALGRFRLMPPQDCKNDYLLDYIGRHSLIEVEGGWTWKFDDTMFDNFNMTTDTHKDLTALRCRMAVFYGEDSYLFTQELADYMFSALDKSVSFTSIPEAQHHLFLDQPLAFVSALRTLLAEWRHSRPLRKFR